ncbi:MAG: hypothetical protein N3A72_06525 [bacterium]|nr:hypothetical protein [bacterium]
MNKKIMYLIVVITMSWCLMITAGNAKKYSDPPSGQGLSTVGTGGDYATLYEAALDFTTTANTGNWTVEILSDTIEPPYTIIFANTVGSNTVLIKPAAGVTATINITQTIDNPGYSGHIYIGCRSTTSGAGLDDLVKTDNIIIDGSNNGTNTRDLTFINQDTTITYAQIFRIVGDCDNITIKNCNIINRTRASAASPHAIQFTSRMTTNATVGLIPDNGKVLNCYIVCTSSVSGHGITVGFSTAAGFPLPTGTCASGMEFRNNLIEARTRGIFLNGVANATIAGNTVRVNQLSTGWYSAGIWHFSANGASGWTMDIYNNVLDKLYSGNTHGGAAYGIGGLDLRNSGGTYNVFNNMLTGFALGGTTVNTSNVIYRGIYAVGNNTCNIYHNSINMAGNPNYQGLVANNANALISGVTTVRIKNNIIRQAQVGAACISIYGLDSATPGMLECDYNDLYADTAAGATTGRWFGVNQLTLSNWTTVTGVDINSQDVDPFATSPNKWVSETDLHFTGVNASPLAPGIPITSPFPITTDIDGNQRSISTPWKGCDEPIPPLYTTPASIVTRPGDPAITINAFGGTPDYYWVVNGGIGTLDVNTGAIVQFTPTDSTAYGSITVTDSTTPTPKKFTIPVSVIPTTAPLFIEAVENKRSSIEQAE